MNNPLEPRYASSVRRFFVATGVVVALWCGGSIVLAQENDVSVESIREVLNDKPVAEPAEPVVAPAVDLLSLILSGGRFMIPIAVTSLLVIALAAERMIRLRRGRVIPRRLRKALKEILDPIDKFKPELAYQICAESPSPAATVIRSMLLRTGQPLGDIERVATETAQREADRYARAVRWLNLAAAATPLMGLLGTVWGMIVAFHESTTLTAGQSRSEQLSEGIYTALVTTLAGLIVAIPAAVLAQYLENRISKLFHEIEQLAFEVAPGLTRFTGKRRLDANGSLHNLDPTAPPAVGSPPPPAPPPRPAKSGSSASGSRTT